MLVKQHQETEEAICYTHYPTLLGQCSNIYWVQFKNSNFCTVSSFAGFIEISMTKVWGAQKLDGVLC